MRIHACVVLLQNSWGISKPCYWSQCQTLTYMHPLVDGIVPCQLREDNSIIIHILCFIITPWTYNHNHTAKPQKLEYMISPTPTLTPIPGVTIETKWLIITCGQTMKFDTVNHNTATHLTVIAHPSTYTDAHIHVHSFKLRHAFLPTIVYIQQWHLYKLKSGMDGAAYSILEMRNDIGFKHIKI